MSRTSWSARVLAWFCKPWLYYISFFCCHNIIAAFTRPACWNTCCHPANEYLARLLYGSLQGALFNMIYEQNALFLLPQAHMSIVSLLNALSMSLLICPAKKGHASIKPSANDCQAGKQGSRWTPSSLCQRISGMQLPS